MPQVDGRWGKAAPVTPGDNTVTGAKVSDASLTGADVQDDSLTASDIANIPQAALADIAVNASAIYVQAEANADRAHLNTLLARLRAAGIISP